MLWLMEYGSYTTGHRSLMLAWFKERYTIDYTSKISAMDFSTGSIEFKSMHARSRFALDVQTLGLCCVYTISQTVIS